MKREKEKERREDARSANNGSDMRVNDASQRCAQFFLYLTLTERVLTARRRWKSRAVGYRSLRTRYICIIPYQVRLELSSNLI